MINRARDYAPIFISGSAGFRRWVLGRDGDQVILRDDVRGAVMTVARPFLSTFVNRVDAKGRISVPARYREVLEGQGSRTIFARASTTGSAIVAGGAEWMAGIQAMIDEHDPSSELYDDFAYAWLGDTVELSLDGEGRVTFPEQLMRHAGLDEAAAFVGKGQCFEVWEPRALEIRKLQARRASTENRGMLRMKNGGGAP